MDFINGDDRDQITFLPGSIDEYVSDDNPVRVIDAYIEQLDFKKMEFSRFQPNETGRPMYNPKDILKLYLYGYINGVRSSRKLEKETYRNLEVIWLLRRITPDHKTIARFRRDNPTALKNVFRDFVKLCIDFNLYGRELVAIDSSKFRAVNSKDRNFSKGKLIERIKRIDARIDEYLSQAEETDADEDKASDIRDGLQADEIKAMTKDLQERKERYQGYVAKLDNGDETQISLTDPDSRLLMNGGKYEVGYSIHTAVDGKNKLIAEFEVTNQANDSKVLSMMAEKATEILDIDALAVLADKGYVAATEIAECIQDGVTPHVDGAEFDICIPTDSSRHETITSHKNGRTIYLRDRNVAICPMGKILYPGFYKKSTNKACFINAAACKGCSCRCMNDKRRIRYEYAIPESQFSKEYDDSNIFVRQIHVTSDKNLLKKRKTIVEHPFGTIKRGKNSSYCLTKGFSSVTGEFSLSFLAYNVQRAIKVLGAQKMIGLLTT